MIQMDAIMARENGWRQATGAERTERPLAQGWGGAPHDLRQFLSDRELLNLCLEAVQALNLTGAELDRLKRGEFRPQMMLTLLTFAYATRVYGSEEIESTLRENASFRYICARKYPDARTIRQFRRFSRAHLEASLAQVFENAWRRAFRPVDTDFTFFHWFDGRLDLLARQAARERLELAVISDTAAFEW
jgi:hypothetical protein